MRRIALTLALTSGLSASASAGDLVLGAESDLRFDDNVYGTSRGEIADGYWTIAPTIELIQTWQPLTAELNFRPTYELYLDESEIDGFSYDADGALTWTPTERTTVEVSDDFRRYRSLRDLDSGGAVRPGREYFNQNSAVFSLSHRTSPKGTFYLSGWHTLWQFEGDTRTDQQSGAASLRYDRLISERTRVGGSLQYSRQKLYPSSGLTRHTDFYNASATIRYVPAETFLFEASVGPTLVLEPKPSSALPSSVQRGNVTRFDLSGNPQVGLVGTCPTLPTGEAFDGPGCVFVDFPFPAFLRLGESIPVTSSVPSQDRDSWTYFADVELSKEWERARISGSYRRDQGASSALGFTSVADAVSLSASWRPLKKLSVYLNSTWENREQAEPSRGTAAFILLDTLPGAGPLPPVNNLVPVEVRVVPVGTGVVVPRAKVRSFGVNIGGDYFLHPALKLEVQAGWGDQDASRGSGFGDVDRFWARVGLDFEYGPIRW